MIRTWLLTAAAISGFIIVHAIAEGARAQQTLTERGVTLLGTAPKSEPRAERRIALVVGNSTYTAENISLPNPQNDAADVAQALERLGFKVLTLINAKKLDFESKVADFARMGENAEVALFFYAGHAMQLQGQNYLMPVDGELKDGDSVWSMVRLDDVRRALDRVSGLKVMILDACRDNPLRIYRSAGGGGSDRDLRHDKTQGMITVYSAAAGERAEDGKGRNSPFTSALLTRIGEAGLEITQMLKLVGADVSTQTGGRQHPEISMLAYDNYFLNRSDRSAWEKIKDSGDRSALQDFIQRFPSSPHYPVVLDRLAHLAPSVQMPPEPVPPNPVLHDKSAVTPEPVMAVPVAQQPVQLASPLPDDHVALPKLDVIADTTPSDRPDKTEAGPSVGPRIEPAADRPDKPPAVAGTGIRQGDGNPPGAARPGKHSGETSEMPPQPVPPNPVLHDQSAVAQEPVMTVPAAQQPVQPASPLQDDHVAIQKLDVIADTTPSDRPDKTEAGPSVGPRIEPAADRPDKPPAAAGTGIRQAGRNPPDAARPGKHSGEKGKSSVRPPAGDAVSPKAPAQPRQQIANAGKPSRPAAPATMVGVF